MRSILVIRLSSMGDVILSTPIVRQLARTYPDATVDVAVASRFSEVYEHNPRVGNVWGIDPSTTADNSDADAIKLQMRDSVAGGHYDLVVDLQHNIRSAALRHGLGNSYALAPKHRLEKLALVWLKKKPSRVTPIVERYQSALAHLPLVNDTQGAEVWTQNDKQTGAYYQRPPRVNVKNVAIAPGAFHATKRWPAAKFAALIEMLHQQGIESHLVGGVSDVAVCEEICRLSSHNPVRAEGATTLQRTIAVLDECDAIVTNDSGVMHLASARHLPTIAIFGSTVKELGFAPYGVPHNIVEHDVSCRPCSHIGRSSCPKGHFNCMNGIDTQQVLASLRRLTA